MKSFLAIILSVLIVQRVAAFAPQPAIRKTLSLSVAVLPPPIEINVAVTSQMQQPSAASSVMQQGVQNYVTAGPAIESSTFSLSLKERPPPPTKEELEAKKRNFNFWFWGGGFVAPFIATVYYFGPKFWKY